MAKTRETVLPVGEERARVDVIARVVSPDVVVSPISGASAALIEIVAFESNIASGPRWLGSRRFGDRIEVIDDTGTRLVIDMSSAVRITATALFPGPLPTHMPEALADLMVPLNEPARRVHLHETLFRLGDRVRIVGTVGARAGGSEGPYRSSATGLVAFTEDEELFLFELPLEG